MAYLAIFNSPVMWFFMTQTGTQLRGGFFRFMTRYMEPFPLPKLDDESAEQLARLADQMLAAQAALSVAKTAATSTADRKLLEQRVQLLDKQINAAVYKLYGLSAEEIAVVEGR